MDDRNETHSAFVQGFMPTPARPEVDVLEGLTTAIIVDQERMGVNCAPPSAHPPTPTRCCASSSAGSASHTSCSPNAFSFNVPSVTAKGAITVECTGGKAKTEARTFTVLGGDGARAATGMGSVSDIDLTQLYDENEVAGRRGHHDPGLHCPMAGTCGSSVRSQLPYKPIAKFTAKQREDFLYAESRKVKFDKMTLTDEGPVPEDSQVDAQQGRLLAAATHPRVRRAGGDVRRLPRVWLDTPRGACVVLEDPGHQHRGRLCDADQRPGEKGARAGRTVRGSLLNGLRHLLDSFVEIGLGYLSLDRPSGTLSGGESQRTRMMRHLGSSLTDVTYVFDEPTIGLHPHDIQRMNDLLR